MIIAKFLYPFSESLTGSYSKWRMWAWECGLRITTARNPFSTCTTGSSVSTDAWRTISRRTTNPLSKCFVCGRICSRDKLIAATPRTHRWVKSRSVLYWWPLAWDFDQFVIIFWGWTKLLSGHLLYVSFYDLPPLVYQEKCPRFVICVCIYAGRDLQMGGEVELDSGFSVMKCVHNCVTNIIKARG